jgi:cytochrome c551/c552
VGRRRGGRRKDSPGKPAQAGSGRSDPAPDRALLDRYCVTCHNARLKTAGLTLDDINPTDVGAHAETWEKVLRKIRAGQMPPVGRPRPEPAAASAFMSALETSLERASDATPNPGRPTVHRLNRTEYANSIRDPLALDTAAACCRPTTPTRTASTTTPTC